MTIAVKAGEKAPVAGTYEAITADGKPVGMLVTRKYGEPLPNLPEGYRWRLMN
jgi:hypothetical protein